MADASPSGHAGDHPRPSTSRPMVTATTPRWVKAFAWVALALLLLFVGLHLSGHGFGGHGHHEMHPPGAIE
jgi:hypothetical protein